MRKENIVKAQSAMEYLMTYGWAILIIGIALAALFELGLFNPSTYVPNLCTLPSGLSCSFTSLSTNGVVQIQIGDSLHDPINITAIGCNTNKTLNNMQAPYNPPSNQIYLSPGTTQVINVQCYSGPSEYSGRVGDLFKGYISLNYTDDATGIPSTVFGSLVAKLT